MEQAATRRNPRRSPTKAARQCNPCKPTSRNRRMGLKRAPKLHILLTWLHSIFSFMERGHFAPLRFAILLIWSGHPIIQASVAPFLAHVVSVHARRDVRSRMFICLVGGPRCGLFARDRTEARNYYIVYIYMCVFLQDFLRGDFCWGDDNGFSNADSRPTIGPFLAVCFTNATVVITMPGYCSRRTYGFNFCNSCNLCIMVLQH